MISTQNIRGFAPIANTKETGRVEDDRARSDHEGDTLGQEAGADMDGPMHCEKAKLTRKSDQNHITSYENNIKSYGNHVKSYGNHKIV